MFTNLGTYIFIYYFIYFYLHKYSDFFFVRQFAVISTMSKLCIILQHNNNHFYPVASTMARDRKQEDAFSSRAY